MAIHYVRASIIKRSEGRSAVAAAAYRSGEKLTDGNGREFDYSNKEDIKHNEILLPAGAASWTHDRGELWRNAEAMETRKDSRLAREITLALPKELSKSAHVTSVRDYSCDTYVLKGMVVDYAIHNKGDGNPHAHIMLTTRKLSSDGFSKKVSREWNDKKLGKKMLRDAWESHVNRTLERQGRSERIDSRSYQERGSIDEPSKHIANPELRKIANDYIKDANMERGVEHERQQIRESTASHNEKIFYSEIATIKKNLNLDEGALLSKKHDSKSEEHKYLGEKINLVSDEISKSVDNLYERSPESIMARHGYIDKRVLQKDKG